MSLLSCTHLTFVELCRIFLLVKYLSHYFAGKVFFFKKLQQKYFHYEQKDPCMLFGAKSDIHYLKHGKRNHKI